MMHIYIAIPTLVFAKVNVLYPQFSTSHGAVVCPTRIYVMYYVVIVESVSEVTLVLVIG